MFAVVCVVGCSVPTENLTRPGSCDPFRLVNVIPAPDSTGVPADVVFTLTFNDFPNPDTISRNTVALYTGFFYHVGRFWVDLVENRAFFKTSGDLSLDLGYTLVLSPGIRSLRGCSLEAPPASPDGQSSNQYAIRFTTAEFGANRAAHPVAPEVTFNQVLDIFAAHCAGSSCHLATATSASSCLPDAAGGLSLCQTDAYADLIGVPSRQVARLVRVAPRDSSRSYLLRKLIDAPPLVGHVGVPGDSLSTDDLRTIESWIDTGAQQQVAQP
jgi:hypothetical protein